MATSLAVQLAHIRSQNATTLDLKAYKKAHSQSLLFEPQVAGDQDFDSIYYLCYEGFEELCCVDSRFLRFSRTIFSEQSKSQDRLQMTSVQNKELDIVLEDFIYLVGARLSLKPALKAVEWILRRFRVHENNTLSFVLAFLPYHMTAVFTTLLSILPPTLPQQLKFLHPYIKSLAYPPRHTIVYSATNSKPFLTALSRFVLKCCEMGYQYPALVSFWASTAAEAVATMIDQAQSARREAQRQNHEDVLLFILPVLNDGLSIGNAPELRIGCYMILIVLASKADLEEDVLTAMMEATVLNWDSTSHAGLICLAILAQQRHQHRLPRKVLKAVLSLSSLEHDLVILHEQYEVDKLVFGIVTGLLKRTVKVGEANRLPQLRIFLEAGLMCKSSLDKVVESILSIVDKKDAAEHESFDLQGSMADLILRLVDSQQVGSQIQSAIKDSNLDHQRLRPRLLSNTEESESRIPSLGDTEMRDEGGQENAKNFDEIVSCIPKMAAHEISFLSHSESYNYDNLAKAFNSIHTSTMNLERFSDLSLLRKTLATTEPFFLSFYIRLWCGNSPETARVAALRAVARYLKASDITHDVQILIPYIIYALADPSWHLRQAAAELVLVLSPVHIKVDEMKERQTETAILGREQIYGHNEHSSRLSWLSPKESYQFVVDLVVPNLEECALDEQAVSHLLSDSLNSSKTIRDSATARPQLKTSLRLSIFSFLSSHTVHSPLYNFKLRMLRMLNKVEKVGSVSRTKLLLPLLSDAASIGEKNLRKFCQEDHIGILDLLSELTRTVTPSDREGVQTLKQILGTTRFEPLQLAAFQRIVTIWPQLKADLHLSLGGVLLKLAVSGVTPGNESQTQQNGAIDALHSVQLSTTALQHFLSEIPTLSIHLQGRPAAAKRRRISNGQKETKLDVDNQSFEEDVRSITLVLELVESSKAERHPSLLKSLFQVVSNLKHAQSHLKTSMEYLQVLALDSMLAIVTKAKTSPDKLIDASVIRVDVLIDYVRTTANPQVRNLALLLVAGLADVAPEAVLHSVMPIFAHMGAHVLRQEDDFSAYVVQQTMESVIPRLVQSLRNGSKDAFAGISELLLNFAAAFEHIPQQRRLNIFASLANKAGTTDYLFALFAILSNKYPGNMKTLELSVQLSSRYSVLTQLQTMEKYLQVVLDAWKPKPNESTNLNLLDQDHSPEATTNALLPLAIAIFKSEPLKLKTTRLLKKETADAVAVQRSLTHTIEKIFLLSQRCQNTSDLESLCEQLLDSSLDSLPTIDFVKTLEDLVARAGGDLRRQILQAFEHRLNAQKLDDPASRAACLDFVPQLVSTIRESTDPLLKRSVVSAIERIVENFGRIDISGVVEAGRTISSDTCLGAEDGSLRVASLLCLATMVEVSGEMIVPIIPTALPKVAENFEFSISEDTEDASLHNACYAVFQAMLLYVPLIVTGPDLDQILKISHESANAEMGPECDQSRVEALQSIARQINFKELCKALDRTWASAVTNGPKAINEHFKVLRAAIDRQPKSAVVQQSETFGGILLKAFSLRRGQLCPRTEDSYDEDEIEAAETAINETAIAMVYKLNDASFRPMFQRIVEWATSTKKDGEGKVFRQTSWYTFLYLFFDTLKSIVTSYAGSIIEDAGEVLQSTKPEDKDYLQLWRRVLQTLQKAFEHDQDGFFQIPSHFASVSTALLSQLDYASQISMIAEVIPAIAELAVASDSATQRKEINAALLKRMRSETASVRLAAVQCERALTDRLGEDWMTLLPEMLPFISELQEDDDELVERETLDWISKIEEILGESLNPMLQ